jgi:hypothetical protein
VTSSATALKTALTFRTLHLKGGQEMAELLYRVQHDMPYDDLLGPEKPETPAPAKSAGTDPTPPGEVPEANNADTSTPENSGESSLIQPNPTKNDESPFLRQIDSSVAA